MRARADILSWILLLTLSVPVFADTPTDAALAQRIEQERARGIVEDALTLAMDRSTSSARHNERVAAAALEMQALGPAAIPFLAEELARSRQDTFFFCAYALGLIGTAAAQEVLTETVHAADAEEGDWASLRKGWACWAVGLMGVADAAAWANEGMHRSGKHSMHDRFSVLDAIAVQTGELGTRVLLTQLDRFSPERTTDYNERLTILRALGWSRNDTALAALESQAREGHAALRLQAIEALGTSDLPRAQTVLFSLLDEPTLALRRAVADALADNFPLASIEQLSERLLTERDSRVRAAFYRILAETRGAGATTQLLEQWGRPDPLDRAALVRVLDRLDPARAVPLLIQAIDDESIQVSVNAIDTLGRIDTQEVRVALRAAIAHPVWNVAHTAIANLVRLEDPLAATPIAARLFDSELHGVVTDARRFLQIDALAGALIDLRNAARADELASAIQRQTDSNLATKLETLSEQLLAIKRCEGRSRCWAKQLDAAGREVRLLAYETLGRSGREREARLLTQRFARSAPADAVAILRALGEMDTPSSRALIERVLLAPEFDPAEHEPLRDIAAWSARRLGDDAMLATLRRAVERRAGRDTRPLVYAAVLAGPEGIQLLDRYRVERMRVVAWERGRELKQLDRLRRKLAHQRTVEEFDVAPERLRF